MLEDRIQPQLWEREYRNRDKGDMQIAFDGNDHHRPARMHALTWKYESI